MLVQWLELLGTEHHARSVSSCADLISELSAPRVDGVILWPPIDDDCMDPEETVLERTCGIPDEHVPGNILFAALAVCLISMAARRKEDEVGVGPCACISACSRRCDRFEPRHAPPSDFGVYVERAALLSACRNCIEYVCVSDLDVCKAYASGTFQSVPLVARSKLATSIMDERLGVACMSLPCSPLMTPSCAFDAAPVSGGLASVVCMARLLEVS